MKDENKEAMLPISTLRECNEFMLSKVIAESEQAIFDIRQQNASFGRKWPVKKLHLIKLHRKQIARCKTILSERSSRILAAALVGETA